MTVEKKLVVVALGGNAILQPGQRGTFEEQMKNVHVTCEQLTHMVESGKYKVVVTHGNGPQVGNILLQNEVGKDVAAPMPLYVCGSESQGLIGYMIQQTLTNLLAEKGRGDIPVATIVTQVVVDAKDEAFTHPTKPVGPFYSAEEAQRLKTGKGYDPVEIVEKEAIRQLVAARSIVIASGGGGIPVLRENGQLRGVDAVIDKDLAGERLAVDVGASIFVILTDISQVKLHYKTPQEKGLTHITVAEAKTYHAEGHFAKGSMEPKVRAAIRFIESGGERAIITSLDKATDALDGKAGTTITRE
jgi:carbamate kinase